jgi:DNA-directed RNA polymerase subunit RPC12/RpoP
MWKRGKCGQCEKTFLAGQVENIDDPSCPYCHSRDVLVKGATNATINRELAALKRMLNLGAQQTPPKVDRVPYIPMLKENNTRKGFFEHGDFLALRDALPDYLKGFVTFGYKTGWRMHEFAGLTWDRVDLENGIVRLEVGETKNDEARTVYLDDEPRKVFHRQREAQKQAQTLTPFVFPSTRGNGHIKQFYKVWAKACSKAGIGEKLFHDFNEKGLTNKLANPLFFLPFSMAGREGFEPPLTESESVVLPLDDLPSNYKIAWRFYITRLRRRKKRNSYIIKF